MHLGATRGPHVRTLLDVEVGLRVIHRWQRRHLSALLGVRQLVNGAEEQRAARAALDTDGLETLRHAVFAAVALHGMPGLTAHMRCIVRAGHRAVAAADALGGIHGNDTVLVLVHRACGTCPRASGVIAMLAGNGEVIREGIAGPLTGLILLPAATFHLVHMAV